MSELLILMAVAIPVVLLGGWALGIRGWEESRRLRREVAVLRAAVEAAGIVVPTAAAVPAAAAPFAASPPPAAPRPVPPPRLTTAQPTAAGPGFEERFTQRWGVWLGAAALLLSGVFLIRYAVEEGWLGPAGRCALAALLGLALVGAGEWLRRRALARPDPGALPDQAPPALAAGGVAVLFGAAYGAAVLYALVPPLAGFALLALAALTGIALALLHGPLVAAIGIAGAYVTPALVETANPSLPGLFAYLLAVTAAALIVLRQVGAAWIGWVATAAAAAWVLVGGGLARGAADLWAPALFAPAAAALQLALLPGAALDRAPARRLAWVPFALLAAALLALVPGAAGEAPAVGILLLSPVALWGAARWPPLDRLPWLAALAGLLLLVLWPLTGWVPTREAVTIEGVVQGLLPIHPWPAEALGSFLTAALLLAGLHAAAGTWGERHRPRALRWAALPAAVPVLTLLVAFARVQGFALDPRWAAAALALAGLSVLLATLAAREGRPLRAGVHAGGAVAALALGAAMLLRAQWLTLAIALFLPPLAWVEARSRLRPLRWVALGVAVVVLVRLLTNWRILDYDLGPTPVWNGLLAAYAAPAVSLAVTAWMFRRRRADLPVAVLEAGALACTTALLLLQVRHYATGGAIGRAEWGFLEQALQAPALALAAGAVLLLARRAGPSQVLAGAWWALALAGLALGARLLMRSPVATGAEVGNWPWLNLLLPAYALPAALAALGAATREMAGRPELRRLLVAYAVAAGFAWTTLSVRHAFHRAQPDLAEAAIAQAELWAYSGGWLAFGAVLLAIGIRLEARRLRLAALGVLGLTILKVFLVDMAELVGLWRVLSFLGLGLSLIALGFVYRRYVVATPGAGWRPPGPGPAPAPAPASPG